MVKIMKNGWYEEGGQFSHYVNNKCHNENSPAVIWKTGSKLWCQNNKWHRIDGPAWERPNGQKRWYYQGKVIKCKSQTEFKRIIRLKLLW